ncbi:fungal-specific transcription factor domain-containing protein [Fimicolochytrium jonesii]|uniref:fungal-specific transcription factor domain-containing protein n=1 Tax=Fimicolochytrium jonesii TaxID=1396493 RepID=UPI0022FF2BCC|nr:fungal-specific transcription factor domain-containing protein [Fimicolochytrium jonesii]KAI8824187.1 fungal-specific transcription factor domain-containing protein [Fimicolochytrium jonesii]
MSASSAMSGAFAHEGQGDGQSEDEHDEDEEVSDSEDGESDNPEGGFNGIALAIHRPVGRKVGTARVSSFIEDTDAPTFCQVPWRAGVTVTDPKSGVLVHAVSLKDPKMIAHRINNNAGNITIVEDVVSDTVLFYGSTSTSNTAALRQSPRFNDGVMSIALRSDVIPANPNLSMDSPPCSPDLVHHLVSLYFTHIHPYFPMIDRAAFTRQLKEQQTEHFCLLLNSMCALVTQQTRSLTAWGITSSAELHRAFFERARSLLAKQFDWPHINNVQALLLLALVGAGTNTNAASYQYIGIAHRQAVELGMHRNLDKLNHPGLDAPMKEQMRATWFCLYILDRYTGVHQGRPFAINDEDCDTPLPRQEETGDVARMIRHVTLSTILGQIANHVNRPTTGRRRRSRSSKDQLVRDIEEQLAHWHDELPVDLQGEPSREVGTWSFHHHLHAMYHTATILLHRIATGGFGGVCASSAVAIRQILEALPLASPPVEDPEASPSSTTQTAADYVFVLPFVVYCGLTASTTFLDMLVEQKMAAQKADGKDAKPGHHQRKRAKTNEKREQADIDVNDVNAELKSSLTAFDRLKDTSQFAVYYGQLIAESLKGPQAKPPDGGPLNAAAYPKPAQGIAEGQNAQPQANYAYPPPVAPYIGHNPNGPQAPVFADYGVRIVPQQQMETLQAPQFVSAPAMFYPQGGFSYPTAYATHPQQQQNSSQAAAYPAYQQPSQHPTMPVPQQEQGIPPPTFNTTYTAASNVAARSVPSIPSGAGGPPPPQLQPNPSQAAFPGQPPPGSYYADSIFSELLNPFFDTSGNWWSDLSGLGDTPACEGDGGVGMPKQEHPYQQSMSNHPMSSVPPSTNDASMATAGTSPPLRATVGTGPLSASPPTLFGGPENSS